jgi:hypothetical protein
MIGLSTLHIGLYVSLISTAEASSINIPTINKLIIIFTDSDDDDDQFIVTVSPDVGNHKTDILHFSEVLVGHRLP